MYNQRDSYNNSGTIVNTRIQVDHRPPIKQWNHQKQQTKKTKMFCLKLELMCHWNFQNVKEQLLKQQFNQLKKYFKNKFLN